MGFAETSHDRELRSRRSPPSLLGGSHDFALHRNVLSPPLPAELARWKP